MLCVLQADPTSVRAATRAATCHLKMGQLSEASQILDTVKALVTASGQALPPELVSKQNDLEVTKRLVSQVQLLIFFDAKDCLITCLVMVVIILAGLAGSV